MQKDSSSSNKCPHCKRRVTIGVRGICKICTILWFHIGTEKYPDVDYITDVEKSTFTKEEKERLHYIETGEYLKETFKGDWFEYTDNPPKPKNNN